VDAFLRWVETLVIFPTGFMGVCFGGMAEGWSVGVDSGQLTKLLPGPICVVVAKMLNVAVAVSNVETGFGFVSHYNA